MHFDFSELRGRIIVKYGSVHSFAEAMGICDSAISEKLSGKRNFTQTQIYNIVEMLGIDKSEIPFYFFTPKTRKTE